MSSFDCSGEHMIRNNLNMLSLVWILNSSYKQTIIIIFRKMHKKIGKIDYLVLQSTDFVHLLTSDKHSQLLTQFDFPFHNKQDYSLSMLSTRTTYFGPRFSIHGLGWCSNPFYSVYNFFYSTFIRRNIQSPKIFQNFLCIILFLETCNYQRYWKQLLWFKLLNEASKLCHDPRIYLKKL